MLQCYIEREINGTMIRFQLSNEEINTAVKTAKINAYLRQLETDRYDFAERVNKRDREIVAEMAYNYYLFGGGADSDDDALTAAVDEYEETVTVNYDILRSAVKWHNVFQYQINDDGEVYACAGTHQFLIDEYVSETDAESYLINNSLCLLNKLKSGLLKLYDVNPDEFKLVKEYILGGIGQR